MYANSGTRPELCHFAACSALELLRCEVASGEPASRGAHQGPAEAPRAARSAASIIDTGSRTGVERQHCAPHSFQRPLGRESERTPRCMRAVSL